jgi:dTDP-4-dehydrorhamnose 3,5-epimerase-like enzyme
MECLLLRIGEQMQFTDSDVNGALIIDPSPHEDERGRFVRAWCANEFAEHGLDFVPVQSNMVFSHFIDYAETGLRDLR